MVPELAMLEIKVKDHATTGANAPIGTFASPVKSLKSGNISIWTDKLLEITEIFHFSFDNFQDTGV